MEEAHAVCENVEERGCRRGRDPEGSCLREVGQSCPAPRAVRPTRRRLSRCLLALATAGSLLGSSRAMPYDAAWGNTWSDGSGVLSSRVLALAEFYDCTGVANSQKSVYSETRSLAE